MEKILRINTGNAGGPSYSEEGLGDYSGLGGRGLTSAIVSQEVPADCHPLGPKNKLIIAPGLLSGTAASTSGRLSVGCKSPLTGGIKESNSGGQAAQVLAKLGYAAIVLEGDSPKGLYQIKIDKSGVQVLPAKDLKMHTNYQLMEEFIDDYVGKGAMISIGTAGEMRLANSTVAVTDPEGRPTRHAGRGGTGAVMGSKGIKLIILDGSETCLRQPKDKEAFTAANKAFVNGLRSHAVTGQGLPTYGTNVLTSIINEAGGYPTYNFKQGKFEACTNLSGELLAEMEQERGGIATHGCHTGCCIQCSGVFVDQDGKFVTKQPEYETVWAHGGNCGISDLDSVAELDFLDDNYGLDTIEMGVTIGLAMEAGIIDYGDAKGAIGLVHEVGKGTALGRILGSGAAAFAKAYGLERAPVVKNQAMPAYDPRVVKGVGVTYATSPMGADHTAGYAVATNILKVGPGQQDNLASAGQVELSRDLQVATAALDSTGMCVFTAFALLDQPETFQALIDMLNACYGLSLSADDVVALGQDILAKERDFNARAGFTKVHDRLPDYFKREAVPPHKTTFDVPDEELDTLFNW